MVLISVNSSDPNNGYDFTNDFAEALVLEPNSTISLVSCLFERQDNFVVNNLNDRFQIKQGSETAILETCALTQGVYTGNTLANEIQQELNVLGAVQGFNYVCHYDSKKSHFEISSAYHKGGLQETVISVWNKTIPHDGNAMCGATEIVVGNPNPDGLLNFATHTDRTRSIIRSNELVETTLIPSKVNGGSFVRMTVDAEIATPAQESRSVVIGFWSNQLNPDAPLEALNTELAGDANLDWLDFGMVIMRDNAGRKGIKIIENGVNIGCVDADGGTRQFNLEAGDSFEVAIFADFQFPFYRYKKAGGVWVDFRVGGGGNNGVQQFDVNQHRGFRFWGVMGGDGTTNISLAGMSQDGQGSQDTNYVEVLPNVLLPGTGELLGFHQDLYILKGANDAVSNSMESDTSLVPDAGSAFHPMIHLNVNNLPLRSIVGSKYNQNATLDSVPTGSQNGISRLLAQMPRYHESNGSSSVDKFGPFYYDYFPYSVRLKNATNINLNELHISITNINGTLANDIKLCNILLNITNEENVGGTGRESIGQHIHAPQTQEQRDVLKSQMIPLKG